jgi:hypothetical protein
MKWMPFLNAVDNKTIQFVSFRPSGSAFALLDRNIKIVGPSAVLNLVEKANIALLPALINLLKDPEKAWAAAIILTSITGADGKLIESFSNEPGKWWESIGVNTYEHWNNWYLENKNNIQWDRSKKIFAAVV